MPEHMRPDPFGKVVEVDRTAGFTPGKALTLEGARASFVSCHLLVSMAKPGDYRLEVSPFPAPSGLQVEQFREWYHFLPKSNAYYPDALAPVPLTLQSKLPAPDNRIAAQTAQGYWLDIWIPANTAPGLYETKAVIETNGRKSNAVLKVRVLAATVPAEDAVTMDHNTYGTSWLAGDYPTLARQGGGDFYLSDRFFSLIHAYHRIFYDHRGTFHQLGYGHGGKVGPEFAPELAGTGRNKRIADWTLFDRHYGPLLDGSAFANTHLGPRPTKLVYLPINPEWPASYLWWGEPGYQQEFINIVSAMEQHFREKGWTNTSFEMFFNHKKRYKAFAWDGDEARFANDLPYLREYDRLLKLAVKRDSPVKFVFRADVSWMLEREIQEFAGIINMWICSHSDMSYLPDAPRIMKARGDIVWTYGGTPEVSKPSSHVTRDVLWPWIWGTDGFVHWLATAPGPDPWFRFEGGGETLIYPGDRFGINEPIPSIRLKIQRNAVQDVTLLNDFAKTKPIAQLRSEAAKRFNGTELKDWRSPRPAYADKDPLDRTNADPGPERSPKFDAGLDAAAWQRVRAYVLELVKGEQR